MNTHRDEIRPRRRGRLHQRLGEGRRLGHAFRFESLFVQSRSIRPELNVIRGSIPFTSPSYGGVGTGPRVQVPLNPKS